MPPISASVRCGVSIDSVSAAAVVMTLHYCVARRSYPQAHGRLSTGFAPMPPSSFDEQKLLREEYRDIEKAVDRFVAVYLTALAAGAFYLLGPDRLTPKQILSGNGGYNIYAVLSLSVVNLAFVCFVLYKGLEIHELMQFATNRAPAGSMIREWEAWRRDATSLTRSIRVYHFAFTSGFPVLVAFGLMSLSFVAVFRVPRSLVDWGALDVLSTASYSWVAVFLLHLVVLPVYVFLNSSEASRRWHALAHLPVGASRSRVVERLKQMSRLRRNGGSRSLPPLD